MAAGYKPSDAGYGGCRSGEHKLFVALTSGSVPLQISVTVPPGPRMPFRAPRSRVSRAFAGVASFNCVGVCVRPQMKEQSNGDMQE